MNLVKDDERLSQDVRELSVFCHDMGIRFGLIINGDDVDTAVDYFRTANSRLVRMKNLDVTPFVDDWVFQSWALSSNKRNYLPPNLPETQLNTHANFVYHALACLFGGRDCADY
jgi:hypothetical protein